MREAAVKMRPAARSGAEEVRRRGISGSTLKIIAVVTMLIDHLGAALVLRIMRTNCFQLAQTDLAGLNTLYTVMRAIGRVAFPIYCFLLVEGFGKTRNVWKYALRLGIFALVSEVPFNLAFCSRVWDFRYQNVFFTLLGGLLAMIASRWLCGRFFTQEPEQVRKIWEVIATLLSSLLFAVLAQLLHTDYGAIGVACIMVLYLCRGRKAMQLAAGAVAFFWEVTAPLAFVPIAFYNGERGLRLKYFFYVFYPAHLLGIYLICAALGIAGQPAV